MPKKLKSIPRFKNEDEEREFWAKIDLTDYFEPSDIKTGILGFSKAGGIFGRL